MKNLRPIPLFLLALLSLVGLSVRATLVTGTDPRFGPNSLTIDTRTQMAWLDLNESLGLSYNQALADTLPGGLFDGYRFATVPDVLGLYSSAGIPTNGYYSLENPSIASLISLVGPTGTFQGWPEIAGITGSFNDRGLLYSAQMYASGVNSQLYYLVTCGPGLFDTQYGPDFSAPDLGDWLVKEVPEPGIGLMAIGGLLLSKWLSFRIARKSHLPQTPKPCARLPLDCSP